MRFVIFSVLLVSLCACSSPADPESASESISDSRANNVAPSQTPTLVPTQSVTDLSPELETLPQESPDIVLIGTFAGADGSAILKVAEKKQRVYKIGEDVLPGATLRIVAQKFVTIDLDGEDLRIPLNTSRTTVDQIKLWAGSPSINARGEILSGTGEVVGRMTANADIVNTEGQVIGRVSANGDIVNAAGQVIGRLGIN